MAAPTRLRLLASTNNARGDLFTRLVGDLFFALSYDNLRFDVHKSGREIDVQGTHRLEPRRLVAECKAHAKKMGGAELNKFFGVVGRERSKDKRTPVTGYFVSLGGFRETGVEQEEETDEQERTILVDGERLIQELIDRHILISHAEATEQAGRCAQHAGLGKQTLPDSAELLGHDLGYIWAIFYSQGKQKSHFALIHADGTPLAEPVAQQVIKADRKCKGTLHKLTYLAPPAPEPDRRELAQAAVDRYRNWIATVCGEIQLDGLPADTNLTTMQLKLEKLFVPLKVVSRSHQPDDDEAQLSKEQETITPLGEFLGLHSRFSLLAKPGGGKSTLLKRLAVAYADPDRLREADDELPEQDWLPLFLRCRDLRDRARRPIRELLDDLPHHAGMNGDEASVFRSQIDEALRSGRALLLVDGLDEISDEGDRTTFAGHLRTFLAMFPQVAMVVTSREAGYRHVAGVIASACEQASLAPFDVSDVQRLCESWHVEVVGDTDTIRSEARELAATIWNNERIRALAENPLMLTTLLVVKRNVGELPTRRVKLYKAAVDVLIRTWNVEGYEPLDEEETLAQLSYVACAMLHDGQQRIGRRRLLELLQQAQAELLAELQFAAVSPSQFIKRIEYRSSLLMQTGHELFDDELQEVYEFRHLTFQEYLAARGFIEEQYPGRDEAQSLTELLEPHFEDERWREVIPLAAVLAGRKAESLIKRLTALCEAMQRETTYSGDDGFTDASVVLLRQCLLDEVQVTPATLRAALRQIARLCEEIHVIGSLVGLRRGKFGEVLQEVAENAYFGADPSWDEYVAAMSELALEAVFRGRTIQFTDDVAESLASWLNSVNHVEQARAAFVCMQLAFIRGGVGDEDRDSLAKRFRPLRDAVGCLLSPDDHPLAMSAAWALAWMGASRLPRTPPEPDVILRLFRLWRNADSRELRRFAAWAFSEQRLLARDTFCAEAWGDCDDWFEQAASNADKHAPLVLAWYRRRPWSDTELVQRLSKIDRAFPFTPTARDLLATLGEDGRRVLETWDAEEAKKKKRQADGDE